MYISLRNIDIEAGDKYQPPAVTSVFPDDGTEGSVEPGLGVNLITGQQRRMRRHDPRHRTQLVLLKVTATFDITNDVTFETEQLWNQIAASSELAVIRPAVGRQHRDQVAGCLAGTCGAESLHQFWIAVIHLYQSLWLLEQALAAPLIQQEIVNDHCTGAIPPAEKDIPSRKGVFIQIPVEQTAYLATGIRAFMHLGLQPVIGTESLNFRVKPYIAGLNDHQVLAMFRMRTMAIGRDDTPHHAVIEGEGPKVHGDKEGRVSVAFIGTRCTQRHGLACLEA
jgi:hypothetical protein